MQEEKRLAEVRYRPYDRYLDGKPSTGTPLCVAFKIGPVPLPVDGLALVLHITTRNFLFRHTSRVFTRTLQGGWSCSAHTHTLLLLLPLLLLLLLLLQSAP